MSTSNNPFKVGDVVRIQRGDGWLTGTVIKTVLARCHIKVPGIVQGQHRVFVEDWHECEEVTDD